jgi:hypothetical protein
MKRVLVIADDLSGAAEIAGIAARFGLPARLLRGCAAPVEDGATVIDTDSRDCSVADAIGAVRRCMAGVRTGEFDLVFKKTDSALRGHILAEVGCIMDALHLSSAVLVPHNPSRGRTIERGRYFIEGVPLDQTSFANDPVHPARTADVLQRLGRLEGRKLQCLEPGKAAPMDGLVIGAARSIEDVNGWAASVPGRATLPVGAADFFTSLLRARGLQSTRGLIARLAGGPRLFICGSAARPTEILVARARAAGIAVCALPDDPQHWHRLVLDSLQQSEAAVAVIGRPVDSAPGAARQFERLLADLTERVLAAIPIQHLFLEGGATASAVCRRMGWNELEICGELATGVVQMRAPGGQSLVVKPGSYLWPEAVWH